jgi:uncharacterized protein YqjF (DUF2071 family)
MMADEPEQTRMTDFAPAFRADWHRPVFIHFRIKPSVLQPQMPLELDLHDGSAWVSLVAFTQCGLRLAGYGRLGSILCAPLATHEFLNLRTYVRIGARSGIYFISEWIPNRLACAIGRRTYGLPYRLASLNYSCVERSGQVACSVAARSSSFRCEGAFDSGASFQAARQSSLAHFLVERYAAFTTRRGTLRRFDVAHAPWSLTKLAVRSLHLDLVESNFDWFRSAEFVAAHFSPGACDVGIGMPVRMRNPMTRAACS